MSDGLTDRCRFVLCNADLAAFARSAVVRSFITENIEHHRDPLTGEVSATSLAEAAANTFDLYEDDDYTIPASLFEISAVVAAASTNLDLNSVHNGADDEDQDDETAP
jgi:hypothetical protein